MFHLFNEKDLKSKGKRKKEKRNIYCYTPYIMDLPSSINTRQRERQMEFTNQRDTITCDTICVVTGSQYPIFLSTNYCLTRFTCILFLLLA